MMQIYHSLDDLRTVQRPIHWAMGFFDGVHLGHRRVMLSADTPGALRGVLTFHPHPLALLCPERAPLLITPDAAQKAELIERVGRADILLQLPFTPELAGTSPAGFLDALQAVCHVAGISVGANWHFGRGGSGNAALLQQEGARRGFRVCICELAQEGAAPVSSGRIRAALAAGQLREAESMLGHPFSICGVVQHGQHLARQLGFPTANIPVAPGAALPAYGVYSVRCHTEQGVYPGIANLGIRPTIQEHKPGPGLEVHLPGQKLELYGSRLSVELLHFLRAERAFASLDELQMQIRLDVQAALALWNA